MEFECITGIKFMEKVLRYWSKERASRALDLLTNDKVARKYAVVGHETNVLG